MTQLNIKKMLATVLVAFSCVGCKQVEEIVKVEEVVEVNPYTLQLALEDVARIVEEDRFDELPLDRSIRKTNVKEAFLQQGGKIGTQAVVEEEMEKGRLFGVLEYETMYSFVEMNEDFKITSMEFSKLPQYVTVEEDEEFVEESYLLGRSPKVQCVVTYPKDVEDAEIFVLVGDGMNVDANGKDGKLRDIAHMLADVGYASIRMEGRLHRDPLVVRRIENYDLDRMFLQDFACMVHKIDDLDVNPSKIHYFGIGEGANLAFANVCNHFEMNGVTVLMDPYDTNDALLVNKWMNGITDETYAKVVEELERDERVDTIDGYPMMYFEQVERMSMDRYYKRMVNPILLVQRNSKEVTSIKRLNGVNVTRVPYVDEELFDETFAREFKQWMDGKDILKLRKKKTKKKK